MDTQQLTWLEVDASGNETSTPGEVFCEGPLFRSSRTVWAVPCGALRPVRVVLVGRGHHVGADSSEGRWLRTGGRLFTKGEAYRETDDRSALAVDTAHHRYLANMAWVRARSKVRPSTEEAFWFKIIEEYRA